MNLLIRNADIFDPTTRSFGIGELYIENGRIAPKASDEPYRVIDAEGCILTPGLIDAHVHYFYRGTENGVQPDANSFCCGVTSAIDGGSCGAANYELYRRSVMAMSAVDIYNLLLVASGGQITDAYPERLDARFFDREKIRSLFAQYADNLAGLKMRLSHGIIEGDEAVDALRAAVRLGDDVEKPLVVHVTDPALPLEKIAGELRPGDMICHVYQGKGGETILDEAGRVKPGILAARKRGVLFDGSNGRSNFDLEVCRAAVNQGFFPDVISSDVNASSAFLQPLHSLPRILSKYLDMGMKLEDVLYAATGAPARFLARYDLASLAPGSVADISLMRLCEKNVTYTDLAGHEMPGTKVLIPQMTIKSGVVVYAQADFG